MSVTMRFGSRSEPWTLSERANFRPGSLETRIRAAVRRCIAEEIERLVDMLDGFDADPDLEDGGDAEPALGWTATMAWGSTDEGEIDHPPIE